MIQKILIQWLRLPRPVLLLATIGAWAVIASLAIVAVQRRHEPARTPGSSLPTVYTVPQILAGWHSHPSAWVGRSVLVRAQSTFSCAMTGPSDPYAQGLRSVPCVEPTQGEPYSVLYDPRTLANIPTVATGGKEVWVIDQTIPASRLMNAPVLRVRLVSHRDCGPLGKGQHPCLLGQDPVVVTQ